MDQVKPQQQTIYHNGVQQQQHQSTNSNKGARKKPYVKITEQPASKALRFRYECEGRSAGSIPGVNSTSENKTFPTIEIVGYKGPALVIVSCVTKDPPHRPHPHNLVGKEGCRKGVCRMEINSDAMRAVFSNLGIQCVKKKDIDSALKTRQELQVDPFLEGFEHRLQPSSIDLNSVRLCFQVFIKKEKTGSCILPLAPVVSDPIFDKKAMSDLVICRLSSCSSTVLGNTQIILLCEKVVKEDISVRFFEENDGQVIWEGYGEFQHSDVHKQTAITFKTPRYHNIDITEPVKVLIQLKRPSDGLTSEAFPFEYIPLDSGRQRFLDLRRNLKRKPDLDILKEILGTEIKQSEQVPNEKVEVINLNTPTHEEPPQPESTQIESQTFLTSTDDNTTNITDDEAKRRSQQEIDLIIDEKMRELEEQQKQTSQDQQDVCLQEVVDILNADHQNENDGDRQITEMNTNEKITEWMNSNKLINMKNQTINESIETNSSTTTATTQVAAQDSDDKTLSDLLEQVAELDGIYTDHVVRRDTYNSTLINELNGMDACVPKTDATLLDSVPTAMEVEESFDDAATYSSLQIAFKNPISIPLNDIMPLTPPVSNLDADFQNDHYDPIEVHSSPTLAVSSALTPPANLQKSNILTHSQSQPQLQLQAPPRPAPPQTSSPHMHITAAEEEKLPPLPPKRLRKQDSNAENRSIEANTDNSSERKPQRQQTPIIIMKTPGQSPPTKRLPQKPGSSNTLPKQKKPGFFSKLFSRRKSKSDLSQSGKQAPDSRMGSKATSPTVSREPSIGHFNINDPNRASVHSAKSLQPLSLPNSPEKKVQKIGKPVGRSVSSVSGKRPAHLNANVIHIPLKGESYNSLPLNEEYSHASTATLSNTLDRKTVSALQLAEIPICEGNMELIAIADRQSLRNLCEDSAQLKRKRQKRNGDPIHILLQEHQTHDHKDGRQGQLNVTCWNTVNVAAVKTEPRDASPQPCTLYQMPTELRTSPHQPLSYNVGSPVLPATQSNQHMTSVSPHYNIPNPMNAFAQTTQTQTQQQHQQYNNNIMIAGPTHWETTNPVSVVDAKSTFATHNLLTAGNAVTGVAVNGAGALWNTTSNHYLSTNHPQYHLQQQHPQLQQQHPQQQHYHQQQAANDNVATSNNGAVGNANPNNSEHGLSNLLNFDSEQLLHVNTEEEKMIRLNCENFFSNLSISQ